MPAYENGKQTRQTIILAARKFFWEKGYQKTRYEDFTRSYGINTGLVHYYFKKKEQIGREIYCEISSDICGITEQITGEKESLLSFVLLYELMWHFFDVFPPYAGFVKDAVELRIHSETIKQLDLPWMDSFNSHYRLGLSSEELQMRTISVVGGQVELIHSYLSGGLSLTPLQCCRYDIRNALHQMNFQDGQIDPVISQAESLMQQYSFQMAEGFRISFQKR